LAKAEKLKPLEVELRRLEDLSKSIVDDFAYMRAREEEMRDTNGEIEHLKEFYRRMTKLKENKTQNYSKTYHVELENCMYVCILNQMFNQIF